MNLRRLVLVGNAHIDIAERYPRLLERLLSGQSGYRLDGMALRVRLGPHRSAPSGSRSVMVLKAAETNAIHTAARVW
ncbi:MAG: hypothetical protein ACOCVK_01835 [bacterium]